MKASRVIALLAVAVFCFTLFAGISLATDKIKVKGKIKDYDLANKTVVVNTDDGKEMAFTIESEEALKKLDDRLYKGDEVKIRYIEKDGKHVIPDSNDLKGTKPGC